MRNVSAGKCIVGGDNYSGCYVGGRGRGFIALQLWVEEGGRMSTVARFRNSDCFVLQNL